MNKNNPTAELGSLKIEQENLRQRRAELMTRLRNAGYSFEEIGKIYGCSRQYVEQTVKDYQGKSSKVTAA